MTHLLRDLLTDLELIPLTLELPPGIEWEAQESCPESDLYAPVLTYGSCLLCPEDQDPEAPAFT